VSAAQGANAAFSATMSKLPALVTGGSGFVGRSVVKHLVARGWPCVVLDICPPADPDLNRFVADGSVQFHAVDLAEPGTVAQVVAGLEGKAWLVHLASKVEPSRLFSGLEEHFRIHINPVVNLMEEIGGRLAGVCFASSIETYGTPQRQPLDETHPTVPFNLYGAGKLNAEHVFRISCDSLGVPLCILRLSHIYGPGEYYQKAMPVFIKACLDRGSVSLQGDGDDSRDFVHTTDVSRAIALALETGRSGIFNIAGGRTVSMRELLGLIQQLCNVSIDVVTVPRQRPKLEYAFDLAAARQGLGYVPTVDLADGLRSEIRWIQEQRR